jgi:hypothetical protein
VQSLHSTNIRYGLNGDTKLHRHRPKESKLTRVSGVFGVKKEFACGDTNKCVPFHFAPHLSMRRNSGEDSKES